MSVAIRIVSSLGQSFRVSKKKVRLDSNLITLQSSRSKTCTPNLENEKAKRMKYKEECDINMDHIYWIVPFSHLIECVCVTIMLQNNLSTSSCLASSLTSDTIHQQKIYNKMKSEDIDKDQLENYQSK